VQVSSLRPPGKAEAHDNVAESVGKLLSVSVQSICNREQQKAVPRAEQLKAMTALLSLSKQKDQVALSDNALTGATDGSG
jgi:hypothetical protein